MSDENRPRLRRIHSDETLESGASRFSLAYWRRQETQQIIESLSQGNDEALQVKTDGRIFNGNVRVKVLEERGFDISVLKREVI